MQSFSGKKIIPIGLSVAAVMVAGLIAWTVITVVSSRSNFSVDIGEITTREKNVPHVPITSVIGRVSAMKDTTLTIHASPRHNPELAAEQEITVHTVTGTKFILTSIPSEIPDSETNPSSLFRSAIGLQPFSHKSRQLIEASKNPAVENVEAGSWKLEAGIFLWGVQLVK